MPLKTKFDFFLKHEIIFVIYMDTMFWTSKTLSLRCKKPAKSFSERERISKHTINMTNSDFVFVQRLRSKSWTYKSKLCFSVFHSVSNFVGFLLVKALPIGTSAPTVRSYTVHSFLHPPLASGARVGARVEVKTEWFREGFKKNSGYQIGFRPLFSAVVHSDF